jgi:hypothetical protein
MSNLVVARRSLLLGSAAVALMPAVAFADGPDVGKPAPPFTAVDSNGKTWSLADLKGKVVVIETTNDGCPYVRKHYSAKNMQDQQREAAAKGVVWLTSASSAKGEQGYVTAQQANDLVKSWDAGTRRRAARPAEQDRPRLRRHGDAAHVHHRCQRRAGLQGRHRFDPVVEHHRHPQGQAVCARRPR